MKRNLQLKHSNYVAFSHFHGSAVNNIGLYKTAHDIEKIGIYETGGKHLEFGNIQKLINITMKHLYAKYYDSNREAFRCCHAPMDDIMRDIVGRAYKAEFRKNLGISGGAWSSIKEDKYKKFQDAIVALIEKSGSDCLPLEFDYMNWGKDYPEDAVSVGLN